LIVRAYAISVTVCLLAGWWNHRASGRELVEMCRAETLSVWHDGYRAALEERDCEILP